MKRVATVLAACLLLLCLCATALLAEQKAEPKGGKKENPLGEPKSAQGLHPSRDEIREAVKQWAKSVSGYPVHCRKFVDLFVDDGLLHFPAPTSSPLAGQRRMYRSCEETTFFAHFREVEAFVSGPLYFSGPSTVAFHRTLLLVTNDTMCRMTLHGIAVLEYVYYSRDPEDPKQRDLVLIREWKDYWDQPELDRQLKGCSWPEVDPEQELRDEEALKLKIQNDPYVLDTQRRREEQQQQQQQEQAPPQPPTPPTPPPQKEEL